MKDALTLNHPITTSIVWEPSYTLTQPKELDDDRIVDYSLNPGKPVGVSLHTVSEGVKLKGLPQPEKVRSILGGLGVRVV